MQACWNTVGSRPYTVDGEQVALRTEIVAIDVAAPARKLRREKSFGILMRFMVLVLSSNHPDDPQAAGVLAVNSNESLP